MGEGEGMSKIKIPKVQLPSTGEIKTFLDAWDYWERLNKEGNLVGEYSPEWWLNVKDDKLRIFCRWVIAENNKKQKLANSRE